MERVDRLEYDLDGLCIMDAHPYIHTRTILRPFFRDHPGEPVPEENFRTLWCKERLTEVDTTTIWLGATAATPSGLTSAHLHHPPFFTVRMPFLPPNQQCQSTEAYVHSVSEKDPRSTG